MKVTVGRQVPIKLNQPIKSEGLYHYDGQGIQVKGTDIETVRHELMHSVLDLSGIGVLLPKKVEEALIVAMDNLFWPAYDEAAKKIQKQG